MCNSKSSAREIIKNDNLGQIANTDELIALIDNIITSNSAQVEQYLGGKEQLFGFFIGQAMKQTKGKASPQILTELFNDAFNKLK